MMLKASDAQNNNATNNPNSNNTDNSEKTKKQKALLLISGGIDSPVAGFLAKKHFELEAIHFSQEPFTDSSPEEKSIKAAKRLGLNELLVVDSGNEFKEIAEKTNREYYFVLIKRFMMKASEKIAQQKNIDYLVTGESLGQVSSQTMSNLNTINNSVEMIILQPLMFFDKQQIIDISRENNFFSESCGAELCDALASGKPKTKTIMKKVEFEEKKCEMEKLVNRTIEKTRVVKL
jgi:thiamine biosynthesis protein ThiI